MISFDRNEHPSSTTMEHSNYIALKLEHVLVAVGFCIGFGFVFCTAIVYYKVKPLQRFKMLNNQTARAHDSSSLSSGNSSFQQTDSRLTSLTASPLLSHAQSPLVATRVTGGSGSGGQHGGGAGTPQLTSPASNREGDYSRAT